MAVKLVFNSYSFNVVVYHYVSEESKKLIFYLSSGLLLNYVNVLFTPNAPNFLRSVIRQNVSYNSILSYFRIPFGNVSQHIFQPELNHLRASVISIEATELFLNCFSSVFGTVPKESVGKW